MKAVKQRAAALRRVLKKDDVRSLARRYFVANGFDGTLTTIGVVVGAYLSGIGDGATVIAIGLGAAVGLGTSGVWSVWEIERAETSRTQEQLEAAMLHSLENTQLTRDLRNEQIVLALAAASGPVIAVLVMLVPFLLVNGAYGLFEATIISISLGILLLGTVGAYMGKISRQRWWVAAMRMGLAGIVVAIISIFLPG